MSNPQVTAQHTVYVKSLTSMQAEKEDLEERKQEKARALEAKEQARRERALGKPAKKGKK
jgi:hypothetical protein